MRPRAVCGRLFGLAEKTIDPLGVWQELNPGAGQRNAAAVPIEQRHAEFELEAADTLRHVRLHRVQRLGCLGDTAGFRGGGKYGEVAGVHGVPSSKVMATSPINHF
jgi:hypothetical protein